MVKVHRSLVFYSICTWHMIKKNSMNTILYVFAYAYVCARGFIHFNMYLKKSKSLQRHDQLNE